MPSIPCLRCNEPFERSRQSHYCKPCRAIVNIENTTERAKQRRELEREIRADATAWVETGGLDSRSDEPLYVRLDEYLESMEFSEISLTRDKKPDGWSSPRGPDEGATSEFEDLRDDLDTIATTAAKDPWFASHPHWNV